MARRWILFLLPLALAAGPTTPDPVRELAGRYSHHFRNGMVTGEKFWSDDVAEVVPVDATHAYVRFELKFYNGHSCSVAGVAAAAGNELVYRDLGNISGDGTRCVLHVARKGDRFAWHDEDSSCQGYCGARGGFGGDSMAWSTKRPIPYLAKLKASQTYHDAIQEWHTGKPAQP
ncbi:MAG: hypothetical protein ABIS14_01975 [Sphingomonas sp.]